MQPKTKMSSGQATFDLKAAREEIAGYDPKKTNAFCHARTATLLKLALDEIERLNSDKLRLGKRLADQAREIGQLKSEAHERVGYYGQRISELNAAYQKAQNSNLLRKQAYESLEKIASEQAKRIAELESENENLREWGISNASDAAREKVKTEKQLAALKKLGQVKRERGKALVEERAQWNAICRDVGADPSDRYCTGEGDDGYPEAREQLRREGKI